MIDVLNNGFVEPLTDEELAALALAADPDIPVGDDAVCRGSSSGPVRATCYLSGTCPRQQQD